MPEERIHEPRGVLKKPIGVLKIRDLRVDRWGGRDRTSSAGRASMSFWFGNTSIKELTSSRLRGVRNTALTLAGTQTHKTRS